MKLRHLILVVAQPVVCAGAQAPSCELFWEVDDGRGWTRGAIVTEVRAVHERLVAEWTLPGGRGFGGTDFDVVVSTGDPLDAVSQLARAAAFRFAAQSIDVFRQGSVLKIDDARDAAAAGAGSYWINVGQTNGDLGPIDHDDPVELFSFDMTFGDAAGTRQTSSVHRMLTTHIGNASMYDAAGSAVYVMANIHGVDVNFVPAPSAAGVALVVCACVGGRRKRGRRDLSGALCGTSAGTE